MSPTTSKRVANDEEKNLQRKRQRLEEDKEEDLDEEEEDDDDLDEVESTTSSQGTLVSYEWMDDPVLVRNNRKYYDSIRIFTSRNRSIVVRKGDAVYLATETDKLVCRVGRFVANASGKKASYKDDDSDYNKNRSKGPIKMESRWFLRKQDLVTKLGQAITPDAEEFVERMDANELVLTNLVESNDISTIDGLCPVLYTGAAQEISEDDFSDNTWICRFFLDIDTMNKTLEWSVFENKGENDDISYNYSDHNDEQSQDVEEESLEVPVTERNQDDGGTNNDTATMGTLSSDDDSASSSSSSSDRSSAVGKSQPIQEGEGTTLRGDIQVGSRYQIKIGPFVPGQTVRSRGPKLVFKPGCITDEKLTEFLEKVASLQNQYLRENDMMNYEPYTPLPQEKAEELMRSDPNNRLLTGSSLSTASMLSGKRCGLNKECCPDSLLEILADHNFDTEAALVFIQKNLNKINVGWTRHEKDFFDAGFRRHEAQLRAIAPAILPTKSMKDIVDYHFRCKIPDQFRKYQEKKREQAVRMIECIETRKYHDSLPSAQNINNYGGSNASDKSENGSQPATDMEKPISSIATTKEERVQRAKQLLLDVKAKFGKKIMCEVASAVRQLQKAYEQDTRDDLFNLMEGAPELQKRFLEFLPKHI